MKARLVLLAAYFALTPMFLLILIFYQIFLHGQGTVLAAKTQVTRVENVEQQEVQAVSAGEEIMQLSREVRISALERFFEKYESPLADYADEIVDNADKYGLDYRLLPAIAMQESTLCLKAPKDTNNCWGFGIYGKKKTAFHTYTEAIQTISKTIANEYHAKGLVEPIQIMSKYTPSNNGEWAENVSYVMNRIESSL